MHFIVWTPSAMLFVQGCNFSWRHFKVIVTEISHANRSCFINISVLKKDNSERRHHVASNVTMSHYNGAKYIPIHEGIITVNDIDYLAEKASVIKSLPVEMKFKGESKDCEWTSGFKAQCFSRKAQQLGNQSSDGFHIMVMEKQTTILDYSPFQSVLVRLRMRINGKSYSIPMEYADGECKIQ